MSNLLVRPPPIILQQIPMLGTRRLRNPLGHRQDLSQRLVRDISQLLAVELWDHQGVAGRERTGVEEGEDAWGFVEGEGGDVACCC